MEKEVETMLSCKLNDKTYTVDFISGRALRELEPAMDMYRRVTEISVAAVQGQEIPEDMRVSISEALDVMAKWFCLCFGNQFTPDELIDGYPADRLMHDIALTLMAVQAQTTHILSEFPTKAADRTEETSKAS